MTALTDALGGLAALGGPVVVLLLVMSVAALAIVLGKLWEFRHLRPAERALAEGARALRAGRDPGPAWAGGLPFAADLAPLVTARLPGPEARQSGEARLAARAAELAGGLRALEAIALAAPLLGLFGTVLGMIDAFRAVEAAGATVDPADLAGGIWVALTTTAVGLAVALPVQLVLTALESRLDRAEMAARLALDALAAPIGGGAHG